MRPHLAGLRAAIARSPIWRAVMPVVLSSLLVASIFWTRSDGMWLAFLGGVLFACLTSQWLFARGASQLDSLREQLATETARARSATEGMRLADARMRLLTDALPSMVLYVDRDERCHYHNRPVVEKTGYAPERIQGQALREITGYAVYPNIAPHISAALSGKTVDYEFTWDSATGEDVVYSARHVPYFADEPQPRGFYLLLTQRERRPMPAVVTSAPAALRAPAPTVARAPAPTVARAPAPAAARVPAPAAAHVPAPAVARVSAPAAAPAVARVRAPAVAPVAAPAVAPVAQASPVVSTEVTTLLGESSETLYLRTMTNELMGSEEDSKVKLARALSQNEFLLYAQKILSLKAGVPDPVCFEILLRLREEEDNLLPPGGFIPIAERYGMMQDLDRWVVRTLMSWSVARQRAEPGWRMPLYCVNLSEAVLGSADFARFVRSELQASNFPGQSVTFEIAEQDAINHHDKVAQLMAALKPAGCRFTIDGFGGTKVSFSYLKGLQLDFIKIDGNIILNILRDPAELAKARAINTVCAKLGIRTIAELVETREALTKLREIGVDYVQGFGIARPGPIAQQQ